MGTEGTIWEMRSPGTECNCGCVIRVAGDVNHSQEVCAAAPALVAYGTAWWLSVSDMDFCLFY